MLTRTQILDHRTFYRSAEWAELRYQALRANAAAHGGRPQCMVDGKTEWHDGAKLVVDHIKPRALYPELALELSNLQVLCCECNRGKGWKFQDRWLAAPVITPQLGLPLHDVSPAPADIAQGGRLRSRSPQSGRGRRFSLDRRRTEQAKWLLRYAAQSGAASEGQGLQAEGVPFSDPLD